MLTEPLRYVVQVALKQAVIYFAQRNTIVAQYFHYGRGGFGCLQRLDIVPFAVIKMFGKKIHLNL